MPDIELGTCDVCRAKRVPMMPKPLTVHENGRKKTFHICEDCSKIVIGSASTDVEILARIYSIGKR